MDVKSVTFRLDAEDRVEIDQVAVPLETLQARLCQLSPTMQFHVIVGAESVL